MYNSIVFLLQVVGWQFDLTLFFFLVDSFEVSDMI